MFVAIDVIRLCPIKKKNITLHKTRLLVVGDLVANRLDKINSSLYNSLTQNKSLQGKRK